VSGRKLFSFLIVAAFVWVASPLLLPVAMGAVFAVLIFPWLERLERFKFRTSRASALLTLGVTIVFLLPAATLIFLGTKAVLQQVRLWKDAPRGAGVGFVESILGLPAVKGLLDRASAWFPGGTRDLISTAEDVASSIGHWLADAVGGFVGQIPGMTMGMAIMVISIYFFLVDGRRLTNFLRRNSVFSSGQTELLIDTFGGMCRGVILATVASGFAQSLIYAAACLAVGGINVALVGFLVFLCSFLPLIGSSPITFGVALQQLLAGNRTGGIVLLVVALFVGLVDNVIRPMVLKGGANLHPLLAFVSAFGGLQVLGFAGVFLGPILAGLFVATVQGLLEPDPRA
jgi:predicted PurR-regulated permease PerM